MYVRGNILIRKFGNCSDVVKSKLFKSYCSNFYGITLWFNFNNVLFDKLNVAYKQIFRSLFKFRRQNTTFNMILNNIDSLVVIRRKLVFNFMNRILNCTNTVVNMLCNSQFFYFSNFTKMYHSVVLSH